MKISKIHALVGCGLSVIGLLIISLATAQSSNVAPASSQAQLVNLADPSVSPNKNSEKIFRGLARYPYPNDGVEIGQGWDSFSEKGTPSRCVEVIEVPIESSAFESNTSEIMSTYSLMKSQSLQAKLSGSLGGFSGGGSFNLSLIHI